MAFHVLGTFASQDDVLAAGYTPVSSPESLKGQNLVVIHSRGKYRHVTITKVGPKRVTVEYITEGGVKDAQRRVERAAAFDPQDYYSQRFAQELKNRDYYARLVAAGEEKWAEHANVGTEDLADRVWAETERLAQTKADFLAEYEENGPEGIANVTTKSVPFSEVFIKA